METETESKVVQVESEKRDPVDQFLARIVVTLDSKQITIPVKTVEETGAFGELVGGILGHAFAGMRKLKQIKTDEKDSNGKTIEAMDPDELWPMIFATLLGRGVPALREMLYAYHPKLKEAGGTAREQTKAALEVLRAAYPLYKDVLEVLLEMAGVSETNLQNLAEKAHSGRR